MKQQFYSNGKLLLTGEYVVLDGALALAIPTKYGQSLLVETINEPKIIWKSLDEKEEVWFESEFFIEDIATPQEIATSRKNETSKDTLTNRLIKILIETKKINPNFLKDATGYKIITKLDFPRDWGLGSSSTLINNIANWAKVDAFKLLENTFGGSGYDIAAAQHNNPISYTLLDGVSTAKEINLHWNFTDQLFFIHLNKKQNSREGIARYQSQLENNSLALAEISKLTSEIICCQNLKEFNTLISQHEEIISGIINTKTVKELLFNDYKGAIKSLGAWGGDFILVTGKVEGMEYFRKKGFKTIIPFKDMIK